MSDEHFGDIRIDVSAVNLIEHMRRFAPDSIRMSECIAEQKATDRAYAILCDSQVIEPITPDKPDVYPYAVQRLCTALVKFWGETRRDGDAPCAKTN